jgi:hypothetical protein
VGCSAVSLPNAPNARTAARGQLKSKSVWFITPLALHQKPRGGWVLQQRHPVFVIVFIIFIL